MRDCFAQGEVIIDMSYFGQCRNRDEFVDGIFVPRGCHEYVLDMHHCSNPEIEICSAGEGRGTWALNYRNINTRDRTALNCSYEPGTLEVNVAARSLAEA